MAVALKDLGYQDQEHRAREENRECVADGANRLRVVCDRERALRRGENARRTAVVRHRRHMRYRRRRAAAAVMTITAAFIVAMATANTAAPDFAAVHGLAAAGALPETGTAGESSVVVITEGGSVWEAVVPLTPPGTSPHDWVAQVLALNDIDPAAVPAGTVVRLPPTG